MQSLLAKESKDPQAAAAPSPLVPLEAWAARRETAENKYFMAAFVLEHKLARVLHRAEEEWERLFHEFVHGKGVK